MNIYITDLNTICNKSDLLSKLTDAEITKYRSFKREIRANQFLVAHALKNDIVKDFPYVSIAHCDNLVVVAASKYPIGIDIENTAKQRHFQPMADLMGFKNIQSLYDFYRAFTSFESEYKMQPNMVKHKQFYKINDYIICVASGNDNILPQWFGTRIIPEQI